MSDKVFRPTSLQLSMGELLNHLAHHLYSETGHHGVVALVVDEDLGLRLGLLPDSEAVFNVSAGRVSVRVARSM